MIWKALGVVGLLLIGLGVAAAFLLSGQLVPYGWQIVLGTALPILLGLLLIGAAFFLRERV